MKYSKLILWCIFLYGQLFGQAHQYPWLASNSAYSALQAVILPPGGFQRISIPSGTFGDWLRQLPIKTENNQVFLYNGRLKSNQNAHYKVLAVDVGKRDLQQCADAVIRLRAEYLFWKKDYENIAFNFTNGERAAFSSWVKGFRPLIKGNQVHWHKKAPRDLSYKNFRAYLKTVFIYAGSYSLNKELVPLKNVQDIAIGDVFIQGGFPGHAIMVIDLAIHPQTAQKAVLLAQSYMPAQEIHILKNPQSASLNPWYLLDDEQGLLNTPEWTFRWQDLKRFQE